MVTLSLDLETHSPVNLRKSGLYVYAEHPQTDIWCMAWAIGKDEPRIWLPGDGVPSLLFRHIALGKAVRAWNATFERILWREILGPRYGFPSLDLKQVYDTMAEAVAMALPASLYMAGRVLQIEQKKDDVGRKLMLRMAKGGTFTPEEHEHLHEYCRQDVRSEREIAGRVLQLRSLERQVYLLDQRINDRGIRLDLPLVEAADELVKARTSVANKVIARLTKDDVESVTKVQALKKWLLKEGVDTDSVDKAAVKRMLSEGLPDTINEVLELRAEVGRTSTAKLSKVWDVVCKDERAHGLLAYHAASTGRWAGRLLQPQNFPRPEVDNPEQFIPAVMARAGDILEVESAGVMAVITSLLRSIVIASEGNRLVGADYSKIEAYVLGWYSHEPFGKRGYEEMAAAIHRVPVDDIVKGSVEYQIGKNTMLGAGFGMGWKKYIEYVFKATGVEISDELAQKAIRTYRETRPGVVQFWRDVEQAASRAVRNKGEVITVGPIRYVLREQVLWCLLPSGRPLAYCLPRFQMRLTPWGEMRSTLTFMGMDSYTHKWKRQNTYGGFFVENIVQATARDIMVNGMLALEEAGYPIVLTVHDEIVADVPEGHGTLEEFMQLMSSTPAWAEGCPIEVEGWEGARWKKV